MLPNLKTNTIVSVLSNRGAAVSGLQNLPALKLPTAPEIVAMRDIPAGVAFDFRFREPYDVLQGQFLQEGDTRYQITGIERYDTPHGSHTLVQAQKPYGSQ